MKICELYKKYREIFWYLVFGVLTTLVNVGAYYLFAHPLSLSVALSTALAWLISVIFAFVTNKLFVFGSKSSKRLLYEIITFFGARLATGALDFALMLIFVEVLGAPDLLMKIISNIVVIILNFVLSKIIVFRRQK
ncbi:MAG: GtrA family protein [Clostridia bacterium]|nr:GtrA family protein [Clostridia bacterium]